MLAGKQGVSVLGWIPYDSLVTQAMVQGKTVIEFNQGPATRAIRDMGQKLFKRM